MLAGCQHVSTRGLQEVADALLGVPISLGGLSALQREMAEALQAPCEELAKEAKEAPVKYVDETGWKRGQRKRWLWVAVTAMAVLLLVEPDRSRNSPHDLLGGQPIGIIVSGRYSVHGGIALSRRQACWAHLERDFKAMQEARGVAGRIGTHLSIQLELLFRYWREVKAGKRKRAWLIEQVEELIRPEVQLLLQQGTECGHAPTESKCCGILEVEEGLWTFVYTEGVEPTNNAAERALRPAVVRRKKSFGSNSEAGETWLGRFLSVTQTLEMRGLAILDYLTDALKAFRAGLDVPLIPLPA